VLSAVTTSLLVCVVNFTIKYTVGATVQNTDSFLVLNLVVHVVTMGFKVLIDLPTCFIFCEINGLVLKHCLGFIFSWWNWNLSIHWLPPFGLVMTICATSFVIKESCILLTKCIYGFKIILTDFISLKTLASLSCNEDPVFCQGGTKFLNIIYMNCELGWMNTCFKILLYYVWAGIAQSV
jgi:hypothetical protein